jgi:hypothetical protein
MPEPLGVRRSRAAGAVVLGADARLQLEDASTRALPPTLQPLLVESGLVKEAKDRP